MSRRVVRMIAIGLQALALSLASHAQPAAGSLPQMGARVDTVSPAFAQSLGLKEPAGALVLDTDAGGPAQKAGLQALDVIVEITGQQVQGPADLQESLGRMRPGFRAPLRVWRNKAMRDVVVEVGAGLQEAPAPAAVAPVQLAPPLLVLPQAPALPVTAYCYGSSFPNPARAAVSRFFELPLKNGSYDDALIWDKLVEFHTALLALKDSRFQPLATDKKFCGGGVCTATRGGGLFSTPQMTMVACKTNRAQSEAEWQLNANVHENVDWPKR